MWRFALGLMSLLVLVDGAAIKQEATREKRETEENREKRETKEKRGATPALEDYVYNVAINCREWPRFDVTDPGECSRVSQTETLQYNPLVGESWNMDKGQHKGCPVDWIAWQGSCYKLNPGNAPNTDYEEARIECQKFSSPLNRRADLVIVNSRAENEFIRNMVDQDRDFWIGARFINSQWVWNTVGGRLGGKGNRYTNWGPGEPSDATDSTAAFMDSDGKWINTDNDYSVPFICEVKQSNNLPGYCRWDAYRSNIDVRAACMCPTSMETCNRRPNCFWYEDPSSPFKECISNSERFYNMLHRLLIRRGKKDFAIKIRYGATPARGHLPLGPYGPAIIGQGNSNPSSTYGVYGLKNPYDTQNGLGMFQGGGLYGPQRHSAVNPYGQPLAGQTPYGQSYGQYGNPYGYQGSYGGSQYGERKQTYHQPSGQYNYAH